MKVMNAPRDAKRKLVKDFLQCVLPSNAYFDDLVADIHRHRESGGIIQLGCKRDATAEVAIAASNGRAARFADTKPLRGAWRIGLNRDSGDTEAAFGDTIATGIRQQGSSFCDEIISLLGELLAGEILDPADTSELLKDRQERIREGEELPDFYMVVPPECGEKDSQEFANLQALAGRVPSLDIIVLDAGGLPDELLALAALADLIDPEPKKRTESSK